ncbi:MAG TPA: gliding motility-associated C-terminal domain-containing protein, partial [Bacteroidales bacterium]|nr:gliding motility-associated C-terminal domain-containing protein [Bacteroidales bacterium]
GATRCTGMPYSVDVWVEPTPRVYGSIDDDDICNNTLITYTLSSPTIATVGIRFNINVINDYPTEISGHSNHANIALPFSHSEGLSNSGDTARMIMYVISPFLLDGNNNPKCPGINDTIKIWVNPTPRATPINAIPEMCYGESTMITLNSPTVMTSGVIEFNYNTTVSDPGIVGDMPVQINRPVGEQLIFDYENNTDTIHSVFYHITPVNNISGCLAGPVNTQEVMVHPHPLQSMAPTVLFTCYGGSNGILTSVLSRNSKPHKIFWDRPSLGFGDTTYYTDENIDDLTIRYTGQYTVTVTDAFGCENTSQMEEVVGVIFQSLLQVIEYPTGYGTTCPDENTGRLYLWEDQGSTGSPPFDYWLVHNSNDTIVTGIFPDKDVPHTIENLPPGHYELFVRDANGCLNEMTHPNAYIIPPQPVTVTFGSTEYAGGYNVSCRNYNDGNVWVSSVSGGNPGGYTFEWYDSDWNLLVTNDTLANIPAGKYYLVTSDVYCSKVDSVELIQPPGMDLVSYDLHYTSDSAYNISCNGGSDGSINIYVTGGSGQLSYFWTDSASYTASTPAITGLKAATYVCKVTDENGCVLRLLPGSELPNFTLTEPDPVEITGNLSLFASGHNINCSGGTGSVDISVTGGSGPGTYLYSWSTENGSGIVQGDEDQTVLTAGTYTLNITDMYGCPAQYDTTLTEPLPLVSILEPKHITCAAPGLDNGEIDLTVSGGASPYSYLWSNLSTSEDLTGLTTGEYSVIITDINGCQLTDTVIVNLPPDVKFSYTLSDHNGNGFNISCYGGSDGSISITPAGGLAPFEYNWTGPSGFTSSSPDLNGLSAGDYSLLITDSNYCTTDTIFTLAEPGELNLTFEPSHSIAGDYNINCAGENTGSINVITENAVGDVSYLWSDGGTTQLRENIPAGTYSVIITDSNFCVARDSITLTEPDSIILAFSVKQPWCPDKPDGEIRLDPSGGVVGTDYTYLWSDNSTSRNLTNVAAGWYSVTVTDINGCAVKDSLNLKPVKEVCLIIPNAISPNGDLVNDVWNIGEIELYPEIEIKIFNRWGILVWNSEKGYPQPWDGKSRGNPLPIDSYHYIIDLHNGTKPMIGNVTIVR